MYEITPFYLNDTKKAIRVALDNDHNPWFVVKDIAILLEYTRTNKAISLCRKCTLKVQFNKINNLPPATKWIPESDFYRLVLRSNMRNAVKIQDWVCEEVLPVIRKTGSYMAAPQLPDFNNPVAAARAWADEVEIKQEALAKIEKDKPKVDFAEKVIDTGQTLKIDEYAKLIDNKTGINIGRNTIFMILRELGYLSMGHDTGLTKNQPYQRYIEQNLFLVKYKDTGSGEKLVTLITGKGQVKLMPKISQYIIDFDINVKVRKSSPKPIAQPVKQPNKNIHKIT